MPARVLRVVVFNRAAEQKLAGSLPGHTVASSTFARRSKWLRGNEVFSNQPSMFVMIPNMFVMVSYQFAMTSWNLTWFHWGSITLYEPQGMRTREGRTASLEWATGWDVQRIWYPSGRRGEVDAKIGLIFCKSCYRVYPWSHDLNNASLLNGPGASLKRQWRRIIS